MSYKNIAGLIPTIQSASLVSSNLKTIKKKKGNLKVEDMTKLAVKNIVGTNLIKLESDIIGSLWM